MNSFGHIELTKNQNISASDILIYFLNFDILSYVVQKNG